MTGAAEGHGVFALTDFGRAPPGRVVDGAGRHACSLVGFHYLLDRAAR